MALTTREARTARSLQGKASAQGFTLIELLVVVAIIALLISILLPSLNTARAQARTTLCATRIGQMTRAMLIYAEDYEEHPPFVCDGLKNPEDAPEELKLEDWISKDMDQMWAVAEADWPEGKCPESGSLFAYTRFDAMYRCPEFERIPNRTQTKFNITRSIFGRKIILPSEPGGGTFYGFFGIGNVLRMSDVHSAAALCMMVDESWAFHVADLSHYQNREIEGPKCADPIWFGFVSEVGQYHGPPVVGPGPMTSAEGQPVPKSIKSGSHGYYDGHVDLVRDFAPGRNAAELFVWFDAAVEWMMGQIRAQRGVNEDFSDIIGSIFD